MVLQIVGHSSQKLFQNDLKSLGLLLIETTNRRKGLFGNGPQGTGGTKTALCLQSLKLGISYGNSYNSWFFNRCNNTFEAFASMKASSCVPFDCFVTVGVVPRIFHREEYIESACTIRW
jgi:hypothetical protein